MRPSIVKAIEGELKSAERVMLPHSGHISMIDDAGMMNDVVADFVRRVEWVSDQGGVGMDTFVPLNHEAEEEIHCDGFHGGSVHSMALLYVVVSFVAGVAIGKYFGRNDGEYREIYHNSHRRKII